ncbi:MAG TPA: RNA polymerase sigma factor [Planctomycetota bacterium]|nr:RNA polymerase sigma factor [Planctomycetota bacterium]
MILVLEPSPGLTEPSDWDLLRRTAADDRDAYAALVGRHYRPAVAFCRQVLGDHHRAEDVVQRGFLNIFRSAGRCEERARFKTFLYRVLLNLCLNEMERRAPLAPLGDEDGEASLAPPRGGFGRTPEDPRATLERSELRAVLDAAVARLPAKHRGALYLREYEGLAYEQIADVLEASLAEVKIWIHRGRKRLATLLRPYLERGEGVG